MAYIHATYTHLHTLYIYWIYCYFSFLCESAFNSPAWVAISGKESALNTHTNTHTHRTYTTHSPTQTHTMAWRFKASKYKNAAPIVPKAEACVREICVGSYQTYGNNIAASAAFMAFNWEHSGSSVAVLPLDDCGRKSKTMPLLHGHTDTVTDLKFSPFHDGLLATASQDCLVSLEGVFSTIYIYPLYWFDIYLA